MHTHGLCIGDLTHHIHVVHATIHNRARRLHQRLVCFPFGALALLIEVQPKHKWATKSARFCNQCPPSMVVTQDVAHNQFPIGFHGHRDNAIGIFHSRRQRLFNKHMCARFHGRNGIIGMAVRIAGHNHKRRHRDRQSLCIRRIHWVSLQFRSIRCTGSVDQPNNFHVRVVMVRQCMAHAHIPKTHNENTYHLTAPLVIPRISCREKITYSTITGKMAIDRAESTAFQSVTNCPINT